jgi:hypothetical protein
MPLHGPLQRNAKGETVDEHGEEGNKEVAGVHKEGEEEIIQRKEKEGEEGEGAD